MKKQIIKIGGGGIAGLSAAISLKSAGFDVLVYEKNGDIGRHHFNDWEGLENWTSDEDVLEFLRRTSIGADFSNYPCYEVIGADSELNKYKVKSEFPMFYLVKRGPDPNSLDQHLKKRAMELGVEFQFNKIIKPEEMDIVAIGHRKQAYGIAIGIEFKTNLPNTVICILDNEIAPKAYAYLIVVNNHATLATCFISLKKYLKVRQQCLEKAIEKFQKLADFTIENPKNFAGCANLGFLKNKDKIYIGEAGGFQDGLLGFGMRYAFLSGWLASQAILKGDNYQSANKIYWQSVEKEIYPLLKTSIVNRFIYEFFSNRTYKRLLKKMIKAKNGHGLVRKHYRPSFYKNLLFPIAKIRAKKYLIT